MTTLDSYIYQFIAKAIFSPLFLPKQVRGIYLRRSVAAGEAILGKSDIDITLIIDNFTQAQKELSIVKKLANWYYRLRHLCPVLGELFIFNKEDIINWHRNKPFRGELAKYWIRIYGEPIPREELVINKEDIFAEFCFWLFDMLPNFYRKNDLFGMQTRHCTVALLEMYNAFFTQEGSFPLPKAKKNEILDFLIKKDKNYKLLRKTLNGLGFGVDQGLKNWIYIEALKLTERMFAYCDEFLNNNMEEKELASLSPPSFICKKYTMIENIPLESSEQSSSLSSMGFPPLLRSLRSLSPLKGRLIAPLNNPNRGIGKYLYFPIPLENEINPIPITKKALKLYLGYWNPWEYYCIRKLNPSFNLPEPNRKALNLYFAKNINRHLVRYPLIMNRNYTHYQNILLQAQLFNDYNIICGDKEELISKYKECYGNFPFNINPTRKSYIEKEYQLLWDITTKLYNESKNFCNNSRKE